MIVTLTAAPRDGHVDVRCAKLTRASDLNDLYTVCTFSLAVRSPFGLTSRRIRDGHVPLGFAPRRASPGEDDVQLVAGRPIVEELKVAERAVERPILYVVEVDLLEVMRTIPYFESLNDSQLLELTTCNM